MGVHSEQVLNNAKIYENLQDAIQDMDRVIAFSRRVGNKKKIDLSPIELCQYINDAPNLNYALVFGRETNGLTDQEANLCDLRCHISANPDFPSINLAQAVAVILYQIYTATDNSHLLGKGGTSPCYAPEADQTTLPATKPILDDTLDFAIQVLHSIDAFTDDTDKHSIKNTLHMLLYRANTTEFMARDIKKIFNRIYLSFYSKGKGYKK